ncbi:MAG TPA: lysophospholipid acyltransferase family protein [Polyangiaceae bacterium]
MQPNRPARQARSGARDRAGDPDIERDSPPPQPSYADDAFPDEGPFSADAHGYYLDDAPNSEETQLGIGSRTVPPAINLAFDTSDDDAFTEVDGFDTSAFADARPSSDSEMEATIQALEARLDGLIRQASEFTYSDENDGAESARPETRAASRAGGHAAAAGQAEEDDQSAVEATRELLSSEYYRRQWGRVGLRRRAEHIDDFGHDPVYERKLAPILDFLCQRYFRCETQGVDNIPAEGRCLVVANHSGTLPLDGVMLRRAVRLRHAAKRELRWLAEDFIFYLPFLGVLMNRLGAVRACQENAQRLLMEESVVVAFPEGTKGVKKLFRQRYQLQRFGRGGYIRLCLRTGTPIVPCAIIGAEETNPLLFRLEQLPRLIGWPYLPVTPTFPLLGPLGLLPAPTKWKIIFGEPLDFEQYGPADANDHVLVGRLSEQVQSAIRDMLARGLAERNGVWLG